MQRLPNIELTPLEVTMLLKNSYSYGGEAVISKYENSLAKLFSRVDQLPISSEWGSDANRLTGMSDAKLRKIERLYELQLPGLVSPLATLTVDGHLIGYTMTHDKDDFVFRVPYRPNKTTYQMLHQTQETLETLAQNDMTYGDLYVRNILYNSNTGKTTLCDIDNMKVGDIPMDVFPPQLRFYLGGKEDDPNTDAFMHNLLTMYCVTKALSYEKVLESIQNKKLYGITLLTKSGRETLQSMKDPENFDGKYLVKSLRKKEAR